MTLHDVGRALRERWVAVVAAILVALLAGAALFLLRPASYTATLTVYAAPRADPASTTPDAAYQGSLLAKERIPSYMQLVTSPQVVSQVITRAKLPTDVDNLTGRVTVTNTTDSVLVDVAVSAPSAAEAVTTANAFGDVLPAAVAQIEQNGVPNAAPAVTLGVIRPVPVPLRPSTPGLGLTLIVALLAGVIVGVAVALVRDALDRSVRTSEDLTDALAGPGLPTPAPPVLASLPTLDRRGADPGGPGSRDAEAYRQLRTALHAGRHAAPGILAVASPGAGEGRTTVTCSLAAAAAAAGLAVVVVDADLRRPMVASMLDVSSRTGLTDVLAGRVDVDAAVRSTRSGVDVVPTGSLPSNPSELLAAGGLADALAALHTRYDLVLVDTPPTLPVTDATVVAEAVDGVVVLARARRTRSGDVARAVRTFDAAGAPVVGAVLVGATTGPMLPVGPGDRSAIAPRSRTGSATPARATGERAPAERAGNREAPTEVARAAGSSRAMPEPRAPEPRAPELRPAGTGRPSVTPTPVPAAGGRSSSRHGLPADTTATTTARPDPRPSPRNGRGPTDEAPTSTARADGSGARGTNGARSHESALSFVRTNGSDQGRNGHAQPPNGYGQNGHAQPANGYGQNGYQNGSGQNGSGQNGDSRNGNGDGYSGHRATDGVPARANGTSRHGRPDPETPRRGR